MTPDAERLIGPEEIADRLSIAPRTAREWMRAGKIPNVLKIGGRGQLRVRESDFVAYLAGIPVADLPKKKAKP